jgi:hypothetical protein
MTHIIQNISPKYNRARKKLCELHMCWHDKNMIEFRLHKGYRITNKDKDISMRWHILFKVLIQSITWDQSKLCELHVCWHDINMIEFSLTKGDRITHPDKEMIVGWHMTAVIELISNLLASTDLISTVYPHSFF